MSLGHIPSFLASQSHFSFQKGRPAESKSSPCPSAAAGGGKKEVVWPEQAVWALLDVYEDKWRELEWGNLRGKHWEEVSASLGAYGSFKAPAQCKNKIEDMKKKYKEKQAKGVVDRNKWPFYSRMEAMFRNLGKTGGGAAGDAAGVLKNSLSPNAEQLLNLGHKVVTGGAFGDEEDEEEEGHEDEDEEEEEEDGSEDDEYRERGKGCYSSRNKRKAASSCGFHKHKKFAASGGEVVSAIRALGELIVRMESSKLEGQKQLMLMRAQAENRRIEMEMKTTEMVMNSQLQLAKMMAEHFSNLRDQ